MGRQAQVALLPIGCAFVLLGVLNHVIFHLNVPHFAIIAAVLAVVCIAIGGWASVQELRGAPAKSPVAQPVAFGVAPAQAPTAPTDTTPAPAPVATGPDDPTIQTNQI